MFWSNPFHKCDWRLSRDHGITWNYHSKPTHDRDMDLDIWIIYRQRASCLPHTWAVRYFTFQLGTASEVHSSSRDIVQSLVQYFTPRLAFHSVTWVRVFTARYARPFHTGIWSRFVQRNTSRFIGQALREDTQKILFPFISEIRLPYVTEYLLAAIYPIYHSILGLPLYNSYIYHCNVFWERRRTREKKREKEKERKKKRERERERERENQNKSLARSTLGNSFSCNI